MYIYNITTNIAEGIKTEWLQWMEGTFIPAMLASKKLEKALLSEVLVEEEMGGVTYSTQYFSKDKETLEAFLKEDLDTILNTFTKFKGQYVDFSTQLSVIKEY